MVKSEGTKFPAGGREQVARAAAKAGPIRPVVSKKKGRPASKGRVHKGRTRN